MTLIEYIEQSIRDIPARNSSYLSLYPETLGSILDRDLIRRIAEVVIKACQEYKP